MGERMNAEAFIVYFYSIAKIPGPKLANKESCFVSCFFANAPCCLVSVFQGYYDLWLGGKIFLFRTEEMHAHHYVFL